MSQNKKSAHFGIKFINAIGLRNFVLNKFIFRPCEASIYLSNQLKEYSFVEVNSEKLKSVKFRIN